jgi:protein-tyrosine phosphatase
MPKTILFLCTGNYYRSRFAELWFNHQAETIGLPWQAASRAIALELGAGNIGPISPTVPRYLAEHGILLDGNLRYPLQVTEADLLAADRVIALHQAEHWPMMLRRFPAWAERIAYWHIPDLGDLPASEALQRIAQQVELLLKNVGRT